MSCVPHYKCELRARATGALACSWACSNGEHASAAPRDAAQWAQETHDEHGMRRKRTTRPGFCMNANHLKIPSGGGAETIYLGEEWLCRGLAGRYCFARRYEDPTQRRWSTDEEPAHERREKYLAPPGWGEVFLKGVLLRRGLARSG